MTFDVGEPSATTTISINPTQDKIDEGASETIVVGVATSLTVITADITLTDDDTASSVTLSLDESIGLRESDGDNLTSLPVEGMSTTVTVTATIDERHHPGGPHRRDAVSVGDRHQSRRRLGGG